MDFTLHKDFASIPARVWNNLLSESITDVPFLRHEYLNIWWSTHGGGEWKRADLMLVSATENGQLIGIAPLFRADHDGRESFLLLGSIEISDYLDLIVRPADLPRFLSGLIDFLAQYGPAGGLPFDWYNLPDESPTLAALKSEAEKRGWTYRQEIYRPTPRIALNGDFEAYLAGIEKKQRHEIRRKMRRAAEYESQVLFCIVNDASKLEEDLEAFFQLMVLDPQKAKFLTDEMRQQMHLSARTAFDNGYLWLAFLEVGGVKTAASFMFDYRNKLWGYNSGVNNDYMELSPGWVLLAYSLKWACEHGRYEFDFMRGDEDYKYRFGGVNKFVMRATVSTE